MVEYTCPLCTGRSVATLATLRGGVLRRCSDCGHRFLEASDVSLDMLYSDHYAGFREDPVFRREATRTVREELVPRVAPPARLLDVGCGNGGFLAIAASAGYQVSGVDVSSAAAELSRARGFDVRLGDLRDEAVVAGGERFEVITFWDVLEHLSDPRSFLSRAHSLLAPGGYLLLKTPRTSIASVRISTVVPRLAGALIGVPAHVQYFHQEGLASVLRQLGFAAQHWLESRPMRAVATGGPMRRRVTRRIVRSLQKVNGDGNLLVLAQRS